MRALTTPADWFDLVEYLYYGISVQENSGKEEFVNTLPYISRPIEEFADFKYVNWESGIYPKFKGGMKAAETDFFTNLIVQRGLTDIVDFGVGGGVEIAGIVERLKQTQYAHGAVEANEFDQTLIDLARQHFAERGLDIPIHKANWLDLPNAEPPYDKRFKFGFLTGNSLTYIGGGTRDYTKGVQQSVIDRFAQMIDEDGYLLIDSRNYDYIRSLMNLPPEQVLKNFTFNYTVYYHGAEREITVFPAYISETVVVIHYYDKTEKVWSKLDLYPTYQTDMLDILSKDFEVEEVFHDFEKGHKDKSLFVQYLAKRKKRGG